MVEAATASGGTSLAGRPELKITPATAEEADMEHNVAANETVHRFSYRGFVLGQFVLATVVVSGILLTTGLISASVAVGSVIGGALGLSATNTVEIAPAGVRVGQRSWQTWEDVSFERKRYSDTLTLGSGRFAPKVPLRNYARTWRVGDGFPRAA